MFGSEHEGEGTGEKGKLNVVTDDAHPLTDNIRFIGGLLEETIG